MKKTSIDWDNVALGWTLIQGELGRLSFAMTESNAKRNHALIGALLAAPPSAPTTALLDCLSDWMEAYEQLKHPMPRASAAESLKLLMSANGLKQADLAAELGGQPVVSAVLRGKRSINAGQALRLAKRFNVSAMLFLNDAGTVSGPPSAPPAPPSPPARASKRRAAT